MSYRFNTYPGDDEYYLPPRGAPEEDLLEACSSRIAAGTSFLQQQAAYPDIAKGRDVIHALETYEEQIPDKLSHVRVPRIKRDIRELVAMLSNLRPTADYTANDVTKYESQGNVLNKLYRAWYLGEEVDRGIRQALQFAGAQGTGYLYITYEKPLRAKVGRIKLTPLSALDYIPFQQGSDNKIQNCETGIIRTEIPVMRARRMYKRDDIVPTHMTQTSLVKGAWQRVTSFFSPYLNASGPNRNKNTLHRVPTVDIYHLYIKDDTINTTGKPIRMGDFDSEGNPETNYSYVVPYQGQKIPTGLRRLKATPEGAPVPNAMTWEPQYEDVTREADATDAMLYPNLRLIICTPDQILYDGPSMWWHGQIPVVQFKFDDWPWNFLGFSLVRDTWRLEESIIGRMRARDDSINARLNPALQYSNNMSEEFDKNFTPRVPGGRIRKNPMEEKPVELVVPIDTYSVPPSTDAELIQDEQRLDWLMGIPDVKSIMQLKQMPDQNSLEKVLGAASPIVTDMARNMEASIRDLGELYKSMAFQFETTPMRMRLLGQDGLTVEDFDYDPGNMIPSHLPGEDTDQPSRYKKMERAKYHIDSFQFNVVPNSLAQITQTLRRMIFIQLWRDKSYPLDPWTLSEQLDIPNVGPAPTDAKNQIDRWKAWLKFVAKTQQEIQQEMQAEAAQSNPLALLQSILGGGQQGAGRPPTGQEPPHFESKNGGARQTVSESK